MMLQHQQQQQQPNAKNQRKIQRSSIQWSFGVFGEFWKNAGHLDWAGFVLVWFLCVCFF